MKHCIIIFILCLAFGKANAQINNGIPNNINALYDASNDVIKINFEIINGNATDFYDVFIEAYKAGEAGSQKLNIKTIDGDLKNVHPDKNLIINWKQRADGYVFDNKISFKILLARKPNISTTKHIIKSVVFPGWGDYKIGNGKHYFTYGIIGYGLITGSVLYNTKSFTNYNSYKNSYNITESNSLYNSAIKASNYSYVFAGGAALVWSLDIANVYRKVKKAKNNLTPENSKYYYNQSQQRTEKLSNLIYLNTKNQYDIALENGENSLKQEKYSDAKKYFETALSYNPTSEEVKVKLANVNSKIKDEESKNNNYQKALADGATYLDSKDYNKAILAFEEAKRIKPKENFPQQKITEITQLLADLERDKNYNESIALGVKALEKQEYESAINYFNQALTYKTNDPLALEKKLKSEQMLYKKQYDAKVKEADIAFNNKNYEEAISLYEDALSFLPNADLPANQINICKKKIEERDLKIADAEYKKLITKADAAFVNKNYDDALKFYTEASQLFTDRPYPYKRIKEIHDFYNAKIISAQNKTKTLTEIYKESLPGVLLIIDLDYNYYNKDYEIVPIGTGFFFSENGYGITNKHIYDALNIKKAFILSGDGGEFEIENWYKMDEELDYAIFKVKKTSKSTITPLKISKDEISPGNNMCIIGNPQGRLFTIKNGIISSVDNNKFEHSAPTAGGSSGSPILNEKGEVIGLHHSGGKDKGQANFGTEIRKIPLYIYK
jgi:tetratricopeptide (TPR) repeat protein